MTIDHNMKKTLLLFCTLIAILVFSCKGDETPEPVPQPKYADLDIVTGLDLYDDNGNPMGRWKSPNHNPGAVYTFPIPSAGTVSLHSQQQIVRVWLIPATCYNDSTTFDIPALSQNLDFEISELETAQIKDIPIPNFNNQINLDFSDVAAGFYRLFYQLNNGELFWENVYIDPNATNIASFEFLDGLCD